MGATADPSKIAAMVRWLSPKTLRELQGFLGSTGYYRRFVTNYEAIKWHLTQQLKKDAFCWTKEAKDAFQRLKTAMIMVPVLGLLDFSKVFVVETDALGCGLGAILMQDHRPIAYYSQVLSAKSQHRSVYERELMAVVLAIQKWRHYFLGWWFIFLTDQRSLKYLMEQKVVLREFQRWVTKLIGYEL